VQLLLITYFNTSLVPLGADLFGYSIADIKQTLGASSALNAVTVIGFIVMLSLFVYLLISLPKRIKVNVPITVIILAIGLITVLTNIAKFSNLVNLDNEYENNLAINKTAYFLSSSISYLSPESTDIDIYADSYIDQYEGDERSAEPFLYPNENEYPFYHTNEVPDVLSPFFKPLQSPPNIVILLVEGLGRAFTNDGAYLGNFTPYLDSLSAKSLYWKNFLSNGGRTFGVLPSVMGSMPFAKNGMLEMGDQMPKHLSLYSLLQYNGYRSSFYYGGDSQFDNMSLFLKRNAVNVIGDLNTIPAGYAKLPAKANGFSWGYADDQVYTYSLNNRKVVNSPEISVTLTVATHDPFLIPNQDRYKKDFEQRMSALGFDETKKATYRNFANQYSSILYADKSIKNYIEAYQKRPDYANTIFIITGDHRMAEIPLRSKIDRFHVPLIIFSPLLKRTAQFESVSTHFDITPSLLAFLKKGAKLTLPTGSSWMGGGLDTARAFRNIHSYPLIQTKTAMVDFIQGVYHLNGNQLFKLNADLGETPVNDDVKLKQMVNSFDNFKRKNDKIANGGKLLPDSILKKYQLR
jgi:phosphoglycerol transferase MdoB-like AlkP superfamily enzyme